MNASQINKFFFLQKILTYRGISWYFFFLTVLICPVLADVQPSVDQYVLEPGDGIQIKVDDEPDLSLETKVSPQGTIHFIFLGELPVAGLTISQVKKIIEEKLDDGYLRNPKVSVSIKEYRLFFIQGEVKTPGGYPYQLNLTVRKAIVLGGGFTDVADKDHITIIRGKDKRFKEQEIGLDDPVFPGDVVTIDASFW